MDTFSNQYVKYYAYDNSMGTKLAYPGTGFYAIIFMWNFGLKRPWASNRKLTKILPAINS
jgi:hypothetical protein